MSELKEFNILFVEDETEVVHSFSRILNMLFDNVFHAHNGLEALEIINQNKIDIVLTDIKMPEMNGIELIKEIKKIDSELPIFVTTAFTDMDLIKQTKELKVNNYFVKPLDVQELLNSCKEILKIA